MKLDRKGIVFKDGTGWYWPFPRLRFWLCNGYWCDHTRPKEGGQTFVAPGDEWTLSIETEPAWEPGDRGDPEQGWCRIDMQMGREMRRCSLCTWCEFR